MGGGVEVHPVDDALQACVLARDRPQLAGDAFADPLRQLADHAPHWLLRILRPQRQVKAHQLVIERHQLERLGAAAHLLGNAVELVVEHVTQTFRKNQRQDVVLVFRCILGAADRAGRIPDPGFQRFVLGLRRCALGVAAGGTASAVAGWAAAVGCLSGLLHGFGPHQRHRIAAPPAAHHDPAPHQLRIHRLVRGLIPAQPLPQHRILHRAAALLQGLQEVVEQLLVGHQGAGASFFRPVCQARTAAGMAVNFPREAYADPASMGA